MKYMSCYAILASCMDFVVGPEEAALRIDLLLARRFATHSRTYFQELLEQGLVRLNGALMKKRDEAKAGDRIEVIFPPQEPSLLVPEDIPLNILFEDEQLIAVNKPPGMVVHPAPGHKSGTFVHALLNHCQGELMLSDPIRPGIIHRLDKDTSGVLIAAKTATAHFHIAKQFSSRQVEKNYLAICCGRPPNGPINAPIGRNPRQRKEMMVVPEGGKEAESEVRVLAVQEKVSLVSVKPRTGRTHQIRVHLKHIGHPVLGDFVYGSLALNKALGAPRLMLHAYRIGLRHPLTDEPLLFVAPIPEDFQQMAKKLFSAETTINLATGRD